MEYLDIYDESGNYLKKEERSIVHRDALWHKTVHCWLYDKDGNIYFQIRKDTETLYTTASGHVLSGESIKEAFGREIKEEIGIDVDYENASLVDVVPFKMDKIKKDGSLFRDRAFANVYTCIYNGDGRNFSYDLNEVLGVVRVNAEETLKLFQRESARIDGMVITTENGVNKLCEEKIALSSFLVNEGETALGKYGKVLNKIIELTSTR